MKLYRVLFAVVLCLVLVFVTVACENADNKDLQNDAESESFESSVEIIGETETEKTPENESVESDFAILNDDYDLSSLNDYNVIRVADRFSYYEYSLMYSAKRLDNTKYAKGQLLLPEGYADGGILNVEFDESARVIHVYTAAEKDGQKYLFDYVFNAESEDVYPISRTLLDKESADSIIKTKNTFSGKIYSAFDSYRSQGSYGDFVLEMPIAFSDYWGYASVEYCENGADLAKAALVISSGYATVYPLEEYVLYTADDDWQYETRRFRWCRAEANKDDDQYYRALDDYNKRDFMYMMKITDNYYAFIDVHYKDRYAPPENAAQTVESMLKQIKVEINK